jgi:hypothetical protein
LYEGDSVIALMPDQSMLTAEYTARAVRFIERHTHQPFFLYRRTPWCMCRSSPVRGFGPVEPGSGDVVEEIDWSVGQVSHAQAPGLDRTRW